MKKILKLILAVVLMASQLTPVVFADDLIFAGAATSDASTNKNTNIQGANAPAMPVNYTPGAADAMPQQGANGSYNSFLASPYSSGFVSQQYYTPSQGATLAAGSLAAPAPSAGSGQAAIQMQAQAANAQVTNARNGSEVNPLGQYSPYMEIIGEGSDYKLGIDDVVTVMVRNQPDFSGRFVVDPEGNLQYNYVGNVSATGKTKEELKAAIIASLKKFVRYPEVAVMISEYRSKFVYVFGSVNQPGKYAMKGNTITVKEAIVAAGLPRMDGSLKNVYLVRPGDKENKQKPSRKKIDLDQLLIKGNMAEDFSLQPGDTLVVNEKYFDKFINAYSKILGPVFQTAAVYELAYGKGDANGFLRRGNK